MRRPLALSRYPARLDNRERALDRLYDRARRVRRRAGRMAPFWLLRGYKCPFVQRQMHRAWIANGGRR